MEKLTISNKFDMAIAFVSSINLDTLDVSGFSFDVDNDTIDMVIDFLQDRKEKASKRSSGERKPTRTQIENEGIKEEILIHMTAGENYRVSDIAEEMEYSPNKLTALLRQLVTEGKVENIKEKRISYYRKTVTE